jgi:hypothetical protein
MNQALMEKNVIQNRLKKCTEQIKSCLPFLLQTVLVEERKDLGFLEH